jgi:hypothetical protein
MILTHQGSSQTAGETAAMHFVDHGIATNHHDVGGTALWP